jgi:hypothetical protein
MDNTEEQTVGSTESTEQVEATVDELLSLLGNETRMEIMQTMWQEFSFSAYVTESREGIPFVELQDAVGVEDSGNFNYHLGQLTDIFLQDREDGYVLTPLGYNLMQAIDQYGEFGYDARESGVLDSPCPYCEGDLVAEYSRGIVSVRCRDCGGLASGGNFTFVEVSGSGTSSLSMAALLDVATLSMVSKIRSSRYGFCWNCSGSLARVLEDCPDHERTDAGICERCETRYRTNVQVECPTCGTSGGGPVLEYAIASPVVTAFYEDCGAGPAAVGPWEYRLAALGSAEETVTETDPLVVDIEFTFDDRNCRVTVTEQDDQIVVRSD